MEGSENPLITASAECDNTESLVIEEYAEEVVCKYIDEGLEYIEKQSIEPEATQANQTSTTTQNPRRIFKIDIVLMLKLLIIHFIFFSALRYLVRNEPQFRNAAPAMPFFSNKTHAYLADFYSGETSGIFFGGKNKITVVMYYAPWSRDSKQMKIPFELVAQEFSGEKMIRFLAVNCFTMQGPCKNQLRPNTFPVITAYANDQELFYYGEYMADSFFKWVTNLIQPFEIIQSKNDAEDFLQRTKFPVIAYIEEVNGIELSSQFHEFTEAALRLNSGSRDRHFLQLAVTTNQSLASYFDLSAAFPIVLKNFSGQHIFFNGEISAKHVTQWILKHFVAKAPSFFLEFNKHFDLHSETLAEILKIGPTILLITQFSILHTNSLAAKFFRLADDYFDCKLEKSYLQYFAYESPYTSCYASIPLHILEDCCCDEALRHDLNKRCDVFESCMPFSLINTSVEKFKVSSCVREKKISHEKLLKECCEYFFLRHKDPNLNEILRNEFYDRKVIESSKMCHEKRVLRFSKLQINKNRVNADSTQITANNVFCNKAAKLNFVAIDSREYSYFLQKWGIKDQNVAVLVDAPNQFLSVLDAQIENNIDGFIGDFFHENLWNRKTSEESLGSPFSLQHDPIHVELSKENRIFSDVLVEIPRLTSSTFNSAVANDNDVLVFFSGGSWHAPSARKAYIMQSLSRIFSPVNDLLKFYVIDVSRNELAYNFDFETYPVLGLFNGDSNELSWIYPIKDQLRIPDIVEFILEHCSHRLRFAFAFDALEKNSLEQNAQDLKRFEHVLSNEIKMASKNLTETIRAKHPIRKYHQELELRKLQVQRSALHRLLVLVEEALSSQSETNRSQLKEIDALLSRIPLLPSLEEF